MPNWYYQVLGDEFGPLSTRELIAAVVEKTIKSDTEVRKEDEKSWTPAMYVEGLMAAADKACKEAAVAENERRKEAAVAENERRRKAQQHAELERSRRENMTVSTAGPIATRDYDVIDSVFGFEVYGENGVLGNKNVDPNHVYQGVKEQLKANAYQLGADSVVNCTFDYRIKVMTDGRGAALGNLVGINVPASQSEYIELFGYGTAIRYIQPRTES